MVEQLKLWMAKKAVTVSDGIVYHNAGTIEGETSGVVIGGSPIQIAINNNEEGYTLNEDLDVTDEDNIYLPEGQSFYIDLNGHDLTTNDILAYGELTLHIDAGTLTVNGLSARNNLTIDGENGIIETSNSTKNTITVAKATANVEISDVQIVGGKYGFYTSTANKITMENTSFTTHSTTAGDSAVKIAATEVSFKNCSIVNENGVGIIADPTSSANANYIFTNTTIVAKNNALNNTSPSSKSSKVVPTYSFEGDGNVVISNTGYAINSTAYNAKFEIEDGYFYGANGVFYISKTTSSATVNGGYFGDGLETHKPLTGEGAYTNITVSKDVEEGTWENGDYTYVYKVGDTTPESGWDLRLITNGTITETGAYFENLKLNFSPANPSIGRTIDAYWIGYKFLAPEAVTSENVANVLYSNNSGETWKSFNNAKDGVLEDRYYLEAWVPITEESALNHSQQKTNMKWTYLFDSDGDKENYQTIIIEVCPENLELVKDGKTVAKYVNWNRIFKVTYVDDETDEILGTEEVVSGEKVENIPEITIPEGMCGYDFDYEYVDDEVAFEDLPITQDMEVRIYFYNHIWGEGEVTKEATCTESGEKTYICGNTETHTKKEVIAHTLEKVAEVPATCEEAGTKEHWKCTRCNKKFSDAEGKTEIAEPEELEALDHDWDEGEVTIEATCTESGEKTYTCENDETHTKKEVIAPLGHNFGEWNIVKEATILEEGKKERICTRCNEKEEEIIPKVETDLMKGDLEGSKTITILDVRLLLQAYINSTETTTWTNEDLYVMYMDGNKKINILDVRLLLQEYINKP